MTLLAHSEALAIGKCPECGSGLIGGPRGGEARNMYCSNRKSCRLGFNVTWYHGRVWWWQPIGEVDDERYAMYARQR